MFNTGRRVVVDDDSRADEKLTDAVSFSNKAVLDWLEVDKLGINNAGSMLQRAGLIKNPDECTDNLSEDLMPLVKSMVTNIMCTKGLDPRLC